jgi:predicted DNA-binding transcriptional regulator YafY
MKLYKILSKLILENTARDEVNNAIDNRQIVNMSYAGDDNTHAGMRTVEIYSFGMSTSGNLVIRAYQISGDTKTFKPEWKLFRLDRINKFEITDSKFETPRPKFNSMGDNMMTTIYNVAKF